MKEQRPNKTGFVTILGNVLPLLLGLTVALALVEVIMRVFPGWLPPEVRVNPPTRRIKDSIDESYELRLSDGDLFHYMQGKIAPLPPDQDQVVAKIHMITDANGFRNSPPYQDVYDVVALGDSFTRASGVAAPWTQGLADQGNLSVLNLGDVGFGPQDELKVLQQYGLDKQPQWVILAYFEGNDLYDAASYEQANPFILLRFGRYMLNQSIEAWHKKEQQAETVFVATSDYQYPISTTINNQNIELAFFTYYVSWLSVEQEVIATSENYRLVKEIILQMQELCNESGTRFLLVYIPSKEHVYLPFLNEVDVQTRAFADVPMLAKDESGFLQFTNTRATPDLTFQHMDDQSELLAEFANEYKILFLDLTTTFQEAASNGMELYYRFDTHWNQLGHELAAEMISQYLEDTFPIQP